MFHTHLFRLEPQSGGGRWLNNTLENNTGDKNPRERLTQFSKMFTNSKAAVVTALLVWSRVHCSPIPEANNDEFNKLLKEASEGTLTVRPNLGKPEPLGTTKTLLDQFFHNPSKS